ncbi:hypothetical protein TIFTF001_019708 [Ficus carica]|uniref:Uncharacterized protein n=1 Tax=Ficus carica TaxID=3494 RepID=A0AA88AE02_FICCA|nr:hypothetical protein TIFTF001_019708 [Ficus carica]
MGCFSTITSELLGSNPRSYFSFCHMASHVTSTIAVFYFPVVNQIRAPAPSSSVPVARLGSTAGLGPSKFTYRSLLADIIQPQDLKELCSVLVVLSGEAAKTIAVNYMLTGADQRSATEKRVEEQSETSLALTSQDRLQNQKESDVEKAVADDCSSGNQGDKTGPDDSGSDGADLPKGRPMSPETLALMCDEQDTMFMAAASPSGTGHGCNISSQQGTTEVYEEQERIVLSKFRDCLKMLIALGEIKGKFISFKKTKCSSLARSEAGTQKDPLSNGITNVKTEASNQPIPTSNGIPKTIVPPTARTTQSFPAAVPAAASADLLPKIPSFPENGDSKPKD